MSPDARMGMTSQTLILAIRYGKIPLLISSDTAYVKVTHGSVIFSAGSRYFSILSFESKIILVFGYSTIL